VIRFISRNSEIMFSVIVSLVRLMVIIYSKYYIIEEIFTTRFKFIVILFYFSIMIIINGKSLFTIFIGWDGLGVSSYWLVAYYLNYKANNARIVTVLRNRIGDFIFIFVIIYCFNSSNNQIILLFIMLLVLLSLTKRAQWPFSRWLPLAMAAPTPVSALVHSRTLVTAGIIIIYRFYDILQPRERMLILCIIATLTILFSSIIGTVELDFKKLLLYQH